jgi:hypothetical protein
MTIAKADEDQLKAMAEDDDDEDDDKALAQFRERRLQELKQRAAKYRFGDVYPIGKDDWVREVSEASKAAWVVVHLFQDSIVECRIVEEIFTKLSAKFRDVKFVKIRSTQAIENWPDKNLPAIFVYHDGVLNSQLITLTSIGGKSATADGKLEILRYFRSKLLLFVVVDLEWWLAERKAVETDLEDDPRNLTGKKSMTRINRRELHDSDDDLDD